MPTFHEPNALALTNAPSAVAPVVTSASSAPSATPLGAAGEPGVPWARYLSAIWRYKWLVVLATLIGAAAGVAAGRRIRPTYSVQATLLVSTDRREHSTDVARTVELVSGTSWVDLLRSYAILERVARRAGLHALPISPQDRVLFAGLIVRDTMRAGRMAIRVDSAASRYTLVDAANTVLETGAVGDSIGRSIGFQWQPPRALLPGGSEHAFTVQSARDAANDISSRLTTVQPEGTSFIRLTLTGGDPKATTAMLNMITDEFISVSAELERRSIVEQSARLRDQAQSAENSLRAAETALERFRVASVTLPSDASATGARANGLDPLLSRYLDAKTELDQLQSDRATLNDAELRLRADPAAVDYVLTLPMLATHAPEVRAAVVTLGAKDTALRAARRDYTDENKIVRDLRQATNELRLETIPRLVAARVDQITRREHELQGNLAASTHVLEGIPPRTLEELRLRRNVALAENMFAKIQNEYESAQLAEAGTVADVSVLDPAVAPAHAPGGRAFQLAALFTTAGGFGGLFFALLLDGVDKRLRRPEQVRDDLDLWVLGSVPRLRRHRKGHVHSIESAQLVEAMRAIRVGIAYALGGDMPIQLTITSPNVGDGKSLVSANLAISFAEAGYRTLLVDGDIRRGDLHSMFGVSRRPGLLDCLSTGLTLDEAVVATEVAQLSILPCGTRYRQGPEMLAGPRLSALLNEARGSYDVIIVDSPPLSVGSDALWESVATGAAAIVLRMDASDVRMAKAKLEVVDRLPVQVVGAVLNDCPTHAEDEYSHYLTHDTVDLDTAIPQRASRVGLLNAGE